MLVAVAFSCKNNEKIVYQKFQATPNSGWTFNDTLNFEFTIEDTAKVFDFWLTVRNETSYHYSNVYMFVYTEFPNGKSALDTMNYLLAYPSGKWLGEVSGTMVESKLIYKHTTVPVSGTYKMSIIQAMRDKNLLDITDIGLKIVEAK
ncbi:MAG: gliding motility lipoprotein GldH [Bacteroidia bacterium]